MDFTQGESDEEDEDKDEDEDKTTNDGSGDDVSVQKPGKVVKRFDPYFESEASAVDFEEEYLDAL